MSQQQPPRMSEEFRDRMRAGLSTMAPHERLRERRRNRAFVGGSAAAVLVIVGAVVAVQGVRGTLLQDQAAPPPPMPSVVETLMPTPTPAPSATPSPEPTAPAATLEPGTVTPPPQATIEPDPTSAPEPSVVEVPTGGPAPQDGQLYDLAISCVSPLEIWIDDGSVAAGGAASWRTLLCGVDTAGFIDYAIPGPDARVFALTAPGDPLPHVERRPHGGSFTAEQNAALRAAGTSLVDAVVWCGTTTGTVSIGAATAECVPNEAAVIDDVESPDVLTQLVGPPGAKLWVILQLQ
ncbi:hypothetical protein FQ330_02405 [Agrococcus sediminis]|uniref:Uncharacterized protein n=1 Tax=Agrococcus sediminis TaxID=2599924 RepID=A0A5M8QM81_9MICO|nr:hypothetical protein [Agrococcus sediminis]KAA6436281.1 hypothetical protein FQ330_02405 [Agrococcus sediminis]